MKFLSHYSQHKMFANSVVVILITAAFGVAAKETHFIDKDSKLKNLFEPQWFKDNIPFVEVPDREIEEVYYYRWSSLKRHLRYTLPGAGYIITEFVHKVGYSQKFDTINAAAGHHIYEARWLRNARYVQVSPNKLREQCGIEQIKRLHRITSTSGREKEELLNNIPNG